MADKELNGTFHFKAKSAKADKTILIPCTVYVAQGRNDNSNTIRVRSRNGHAFIHDDRLYKYNDELSINIDEVIGLNFDEKGHPIIKKTNKEEE